MDTFNKRKFGSRVKKEETAVKGVEEKGCQEIIFNYTPYNTNKSDLLQGLTEAYELLPIHQATYSRIQHLPQLNCANNCRNIHRDQLCARRIMARGRRSSSPDDDGYKRFTEDIHNVSYGSNSTSDEMGSRSTLCCDNDQEMERGEGNWEMNYHEAAIFLEEGQNNEKFDSHPRHPNDLPAYLLVHNAWYYGLDLIMSIIILLLALVEAPSVDNFQVFISVACEG
ncbi:uncharacterized protein LOC116161399 [Photinus pyralis]|uniref:uncharacterized protein LOC116161399 n=1 Tax=Photinus pyralis TaxID=7054 RepID=UPI001267266F|nr:uncharacterized protein LOC116161399 [Photinus pyralis]